MKQKSINLIASYFVQWFDADYHAAGVVGKIRDIDRVNWIRCLPFVILHLGCLGIFVVGWSWTAVCAAIALYIVRMFAITGIYHRYFSHRTFKTSRPAQFLFALLGASSAQRGYASDTKATIRPSGETTIGGCTPAPSVVMARAFFPSPSATYSCGAPSRVETNAMRSLERKRGESSPFGPSMNGRGGAEPSAGTVQMSAFRLPDARSVVVRTKSTRRPSGESCGSPTRTAVSRSSSAMGRLACALTGAGRRTLAARPRAAIERRVRDMAVERE